MKFTPEQLEKAKAAKSAEELLALAKENGIELTTEEAAKYFAELHREGELTDEEVGNVNGGMKIILFDKPKFLDPILRLIFKIKKKPSDEATSNAVINDPVLSNKNDDVE